VSQTSEGHASNRNVDDLTWISPAFPSCGRVTQDKHYKNKTTGDQSGPDPVHPLIFLGRGFILIDGKKTQDQAREGETRQQVQRASPGRTANALAVKLKLNHTYINSPPPGHLRKDTAENGAEGGADWGPGGERCEGNGA
jgi:hypothetical protein